MPIQKERAIALCANSMLFVYLQAGNSNSGQNTGEEQH